MNQNVIVLYDRSDNTKMRAFGPFDGDPSMADLLAFAQKQQLSHEDFFIVPTVTECAACGSGPFSSVHHPAAECNPCERPNDHHEFEVAS